MADLPLLTMKLDGPEVEFGRIPVDHLLLVLNRVQVCVKRIGMELLGEQSKVGAGRFKGPVESACRLDVVAFSGGSFSVGIDVPTEDLVKEAAFFEGGHLGKLAVGKLVEGIKALGSDKPTLLNEFGYGVLMALKDVGKVFERGVVSVGFDMRNGDDQSHLAVFDLRVRDQVLSHIEMPTISQFKANGSLREVRLQDRSCKLFPPHGKPIECVFSDQLEPKVRTSLGYYVSVTGEAERIKSEGRVNRLNLESIEILGQRPQVVQLLPSKPTDAKSLMQSMRDAGAVGMWKDREDINDSSEFAAKLRSRIQEREREGNDPA